MPDCQAARTPRILWVELTSKCPFDCIFCSRKTRRGVGQHLPFAVYRAMLDELVDPRRFILNYSGESTVYPELIPAIQAARSTGGYVELVSALATVPESMLDPLAASGLNRLTVSVHATDPAKYEEVYRYASFATLRERLERFAAICRSRPGAPVVDLAFVAMDTNLAQLPSVTAWASSLGLRDIFIFPVLRRDEIPVPFPTELTALGAHRPGFRERVRTMVSRAAEDQPGVRLTVCDESFTADTVDLGQVPRAYPHPLPPGAHIHSCEQNPWETAHVLSNGDVVACEVLDKFPLGNLHEQPLREIWHGERYQRFRRRYRRGEVAECRSCPWKRAYMPSPISSEILASRGASAQLLYGWHDSTGDGHIWSSQQSVAMLAPHADSKVLHVSGVLPPGPEGDPAELAISLNGAEIGRVTNPWPEDMPFGLDFPAAHAGPWKIEFRTRHVCRRSPDQRDLGFALTLLVSKEHHEPAACKRRQKDLQPVAAWIGAIDRWGARLKRCRGNAGAAPDGKAPDGGLSIVIPERDNLDELAACLASVRESAARWEEPLETIVIVNGAPEAMYEPLRRAYPEARWRFHAGPLGFAGAIQRGLREVRYGWVYLLNSDVALDPQALCALAPHRDSRSFSIASQIVLKDSTRYREETNWGALLIDSGLATIHDWIPTSARPVESFYAGGGASLFQTRLLRRLLAPSVYRPFYWEDVEWGWRARKLGYRSWFCPASVAHHRQHSTIARHYGAEEVETILRRHRLLFHLRNFTAAGSVQPALEEIARSPEPVASYFLTRQARWEIARGRLWNHMAPLGDEEVFAAWNAAVGPVASPRPVMDRSHAR